MGDPVRLVLLEAVLGEIKQRNLIQNVRETGEVLLAGLKELQVSGRVGLAGRGGVWAQSGSGRISAMLRVGWGWLVGVESGSGRIGTMVRVGGAGW